MPASKTEMSTSTNLEKHEKKNLIKSTCTLIILRCYEIAVLVNQVKWSVNEWKALNMKIMSIHQKKSGQIHSNLKQNRSKILIQFFSSLLLFGSIIQQKKNYALHSARLLVYNEACKSEKTIITIIYCDDHNIP